MSSDTPKALHRFQGCIELIEQARSICICGHTNPDGDALGSVFALTGALKQLYPQKSITPLLAHETQVPPHFTFLDQSQYALSALAYDGVPDLFVALDVPEMHRLDKAESLAKRSKHRIIIDHHLPTVEPWADIVVADPNAAATGLLILELLDKLHFTLNASVAQCLLCAIVCDTGSFKYQNTSVACFKAAARLSGCGASANEIATHVFEQESFAHLHLKALILNRLQLLLEGRVAYSYLAQDDLVRFGATKDDLGGLIDEIRTTQGVEIALLLRELAHEGCVRGNLRAKGNVDVAQVASQFRVGGGHKAAAGFTEKGSIEEVLTRVLPLLEIALDTV